MTDKNESRLLIILRSDLEIRVSDIAFSLSNAMRDHICSCMNGENRERLNYYQNIQPLYPKICKRYKEKDVSQMQECIKEVRKTLPVAYIKLMRWNGETGETIGYIVGPAYDSELPKFLRGLQLMTKNTIKPDGCIAGQVALDSTRAGQKETLRLFYRTDIEIPHGKLIPQLAHALQKFWMGRPIGDFLKEWNLLLIQTDLEGLQRYCNPANIITDAGRTVFPEPTMTTGYGIPSDDLT